MSKPNLILATGYVLVGAGFFLEASRAKRGTPPVPAPGPGYVPQLVGTPTKQRGVSGLGLAQTDIDKLKTGDIRKMQITTVRNINERVSYIKGLIIKSSQSAQIVERARKVVSRKCGDSWCVPEKDWWAEVKAIFEFAKKNLRYTRDHAFVDQFSSAEASLRMHAGDCDDGTILLGAMLMSIGYRVKCRVIQSKGSDTWSHIYLLVGLDPTGTPTRWVPLDWSVNRPAGWQVDGADECARTGKPAGLVVKLKDYDV